MRPWLTVLCLGTAASLAIVAVGPELRTAVALPLMVVALIVVWRRTAQLPPTARHAFTYFCAAGTVSLVGALVRFGHGMVTGAVDPLPSPADAVFVVAYLLFILGGIRFYRYRVQEPEEDGWLDSLIVTAAIGLLVWDVLLVPYLRDSNVIAGGRLMNAIYSVLTLTLLGITVRVISSPGRRVPSYYLFGAAVSCFLLTDLLSTLQYARDWTGDYGLMMTLPVYTLFGAAIYHPTAGELTTPLDDVEPTMSIGRIAGLATALLVSPILMVRQLRLPDASEFEPLIIVSGFIMAVLVTYRLYRLVTDREQMTAHAESLQHVNERLVTATSLDEIYSLTVQAALAVDSRAISGATLFVDGAGDETMLAVASAGDAPDSWSAVDEASAHRHASGERRVAWHAGLHLLRLDTDFDALLVVHTRLDLDRFERRYLTTLGQGTALALRAFQAREQLAEDRGRRRLDALVQNSDDLVLVAGGTREPFDYVSPAARTLLDEASQAERPRTIADLIHPDDRAEFVRRCDGLLSGEHTPGEDLRLATGRAGWRWFDVVATNLRDHPEVGGLVINGRDATGRRAAEQSMRESEARFRALVQNSADIVAIIDEGLIRYASPSVMRVLGYDPSALVGQDVGDLVLPEDRYLMDASLDGLHPGSALTAEFRVRTSEGNYLTMEALLTDLRDEPAVGGVVVNARDITVPRELESKLRQAAYFDPLTGLPNRAYLEERVHTALQEARRAPHHIAVLFIDLDDFKDVNDGFGREAGDVVLKTVARRLEEQTRARDVAVRLSGDEFAVLVTECYADAELEELTTRLLEALRLPMLIGDQSVSISASIGIASSKSPRSDEDDLLREADAAMYLAKEQGKGRAELFKDSRRREAAERVELTNDMRLGLDAGQFFLAYQPIVDLDGPTIVGVEALARWNHPGRGLLMPGAFIPLAEQNGLIAQLGRFVMSSACEQLAAWRCEGGVLSTLSVSVNLSTQQMRDPAVVEHVESLLSFHDIDPSRLTLEVTESLLAQDPNVMLDRLQQLKMTGVSLAIDDFGTGYSSLSYLQRYPFDILKIDRSFIAPLEAGSESAHAVVRTIVELARELGTSTVAEGIETREVYHSVRDLGCPRGQGYYFAKPCEPRALRLVAERLASTAAGSGASDGAISWSLESDLLRQATADLPTEMA